MLFLHSFTNTLWKPTSVLAVDWTMRLSLPAMIGAALKKLVDWWVKTSSEQASKIGYKTVWVDATLPSV